MSIKTEIPGRLYGDKKISHNIFGFIDQVFFDIFFITKATTTSDKSDKIKSGQQALQNGKHIGCLGKEIRIVRITIQNHYHSNIFEIIK